MSIRTEQNHEHDFCYRPILRAASAAVRDVCEQGASVTGALELELGQRSTAQRPPVSMLSTSPTAS